MQLAWELALYEVHRHMNYVGASATSEPPLSGHYSAVLEGLSDESSPPSLPIHRFGAGTPRRLKLAPNFHRRRRSRSGA
ncbi:hypothetical protein M5D96_002065 [Drosophila gunungcola]|uniref:Uncharacterized protein n=1 Tax=Drosophila gunungcola TaxID=103775 RepID=A0A9Q0BVM0_9MUSC|nr:hypothetical protein M5D96_002065 [Drosophila gunungcola]